MVVSSLISLGRSVSLACSIHVTSHAVGVKGKHTWTLFPWFLMIILQQGGLAVCNHQCVWNTPLGHFSTAIPSTGAVSDVRTAFHLRGTAKVVSNSQTRSMILDTYLHLKDPLPHCKRKSKCQRNRRLGEGR
ncbi:hypothetical protein mRhiFer1_008666 [Rhinolophus ferrumequinum]|uniref:Uncharacterized protein n=1 Tax=Rhinolophus ferrumequinum TaxID=59479 RepID=A0A7J7U0Z0_RHIFE|nr:hypothetical protein mRhiFer1_008666 [Rhinolophus ferrumequinum]